MNKQYRFNRYNIGFGNSISKKKFNSPNNRIDLSSYDRHRSTISYNIGKLEYYYEKMNDKGIYREYKCNISLHKSKEILAKFSISTGRRVEDLQFYLPSINEINNSSILITPVKAFFYYDNSVNEYLIDNIECPITNGKYIKSLRFYLK